MEGPTTLEAFAFVGSMCLVTVAIIICALLNNLDEIKEGRKEMDDWEAGYKDGKAGPKGGAPIGKGVTYEYKNGFCESKKTREFVEKFRVTEPDWW